MELTVRAATFFNEGGLFMYPIAAVLILTLAIALERFVFLTVSLHRNRCLWKKLEPLLKGANLGEAEQLLKSSRATIAVVLLGTLQQSRSSGHFSDMETVAEQQLFEILPGVERRTSYLATFSNVATLLGLLGTVFGLIGAFGALGNADPMEKANLLSAGISEAMSCTAFGLMVAIPALLLHAYLQNQTLSLIDAMENASARFVRWLRRPAAVVAA
ncbi:MotA/TolQ/ExbB proton channel family protein [Spongiibacter taiwanensis]|uniref:MotA/TolQ/ExbB proton channel family protein n=1 Tax=Spongiibacter taiwanensis TaxID=1748242 RepID=UPI002036137B|nr:MotA/TolQ/ExbB proton channel family protein [Spongiibacter taiwanensis]USA44387.1 MotA/TolQ/ExbB proton channel family protein [Spongiibacter taiwanensis]